MAVGYNDEFTADEYEVLVAGVIPCEMEDRWFVFFEQPYLYVHHSWNGELFFRVELAEATEGAVVRSAVAHHKAGSPSSQATMEEALLLGLILRRFVLQQDLPIPDALRQGFRWRKP